MLITYQCDLMSYSFNGQRYASTYMPPAGMKNEEKATSCSVRVIINSSFSPYEKLLLQNLLLLL